MSETDLTKVLHRECRLIRRLANELLDGYWSSGWGVTLEPHCSYEGDVEYTFKANVRITLRQTRSWDEIHIAEDVIRQVVEHVRMVDIHASQPELPEIKSDEDEEGLPPAR